MQPILIQTNDALIHCLNDIAGQNHIFLDTEFIREKTYYPILCLIQIYTSGDKVYLIDVLSTELDLVPFMDYLKNPNLLKVFHSGRQDIEIFYHDFGFIPMPLFDTQIAAGYLGYGDSAGFESIVKSTQDIAIDKSQQRTNWLNRPLNHKQILYAASDVYYLAPLFHILSEQLTTQNRHSWIQAELSVLTSENTYKPNIDNLLKRFKYRSNNPVQIAILYQLLDMREKIAMKQNMIRNKVLSDDVLVSICERRPQSVADLRLIKPIKSEDIAQYGQDIIQIVCNILEQPVPETPIQNTNITPSQERLIGFLTLYIKQISEDTHISMRILAQQNEIWDCAVTGNAAFMNDWRYELFGKNINAIMQGKKSMAFIAGKVVLLDNDL